MSSFIIMQYTDDIYVYKEVYRPSTEFLTVKRRFNAMGTLTSNFFQNGKEILESSCKLSLFRRVLTINYQDLPVLLELKKRKGNYKLIEGNNAFAVKRKYFKNPMYELYANDELKGVVNRKLNKWTEAPNLFEVLLSAGDAVNFYMLLFFLVYLPPTMET